MPESTTNFEAGLRQAYHEMARDRQLTEDDRMLVNGFFRQRGLLGAFARWRAHMRVRRHYIETEGAPRFVRLEWNWLVEWIKQHWVDIARFLLAILPLLLSEDAAARIQSR